MAPDGPGTLTDCRLDKIAYASIDLNSMIAEMAVAERIWDQITPGGMIVLGEDVFGGHEDQNQTWNDIANFKDRIILAMPTGQGILMRQAALPRVFAVDAVRLARVPPRHDWPIKRTRPMITQFGADTALLLIDVQTGVHKLDHWGGPTGRMNNPGCQDRLVALLTAFRTAGRPVAFTQHDSVEPDSPLKLSLPTGAQLPGLEIEPGDICVRKSVNSAFVGTPLELELRRLGIHRLVVAGYFTNFCVETSVRMAGNMGFDVYLAHDACATCNRIDLNGVDHDPDLVHDLSVAAMHGEFCTALTSQQIIALLSAPSDTLNRAQGNELTSQKPEIRTA